MTPKTHFELDTSGGPVHLDYWGIVTLRNGHTFYIGPFRSRSTAYRHAVKRMRELNR